MINFKSSSPLLLDVARKLSAVKIQDALEEAALMYPRERFLIKFWSKRTREWYCRDDSDWPSEAWREICADQGLAISLDQAGNVLTAQSTPSFVFALLAAIELKKGDSVLEVGFCTGWLASLAAYMVGSGGKIIGVEIDPISFSISESLALEYPANFIRRFGDIDQRHDQKFDVVISTSAGDIDYALVSAVSPQGRLSCAVRIPGGCDRTILFQRDGKHLVPYRSEYTRSVPASGSVCLPAHDAINVLASDLIPLSSEHHLIQEMNFVKFREFLFRTEPSFRLFRITDESGYVFMSFGLAQGNSYAVVGATRLHGMYPSVLASNLESRIALYLETVDAGLEFAPLITLSPQGHGECETEWIRIPKLPPLIQSGRPVT